MFQYSEQQDCTTALLNLKAEARIAQMQTTNQQARTLVMPHRKRKYSEAGRHAAWWSFVHLLVHHVADYFMIIAIVCYQLKIMWKRQHSCFLLQTFCVSPYKSGLHVPLVDPFLFDNIRNLLAILLGYSTP